MTESIIVNRIEEHDKHKPILLDKIALFQRNNETFTKMTHSVDMYTDWQLPRDVKREYWTYFRSLIEPTMDKIAHTIGFIDSTYKWRIGAWWFQQYLEGGTHDWHNHPRTHFANCYFLELPDEQYITEIIGANGKICKIHAIEGDIITFPAWMKHRSRPNGKERKTVIAFNSNYEITNG